MVNWIQIRKKRIVGICKKNFSCIFYLADLPEGLDREIDCTIFDADNTIESDDDEKKFEELPEDEDIQEDMQEEEKVKLLPTSCIKLSFLDLQQNPLPFDLDVTALRASFLQNIELHFGISEKQKYHIRHGTHSDFVTVTVDAPASKSVRVNLEQKELEPFLQSPVLLEQVQEPLLNKFIARYRQENTANGGTTNSGTCDFSFFGLGAQLEMENEGRGARNNRIVSRSVDDDDGITGATCARNGVIVSRSVESSANYGPMGPRGTRGSPGLGPTGPRGHGFTGPPSGISLSVSSFLKLKKDMEEKIEERFQKMEEQQEEFFQRMQEQIDDATSLVRYNPYIAGAEVNRLTVSMMERENANSCAVANSAEGQHNNQRMGVNDPDHYTRLEARCMALTNLFLRQNPNIAHELWQEIELQEERYLGRDVDGKDDEDVDENMENEKDD